MGKSIADCIGRHIPKARHAEFNKAIQLKMDGHKADGWGPDKLKVLSIQDMIDDLLTDRKEVMAAVSEKFGKSVDTGKPETVEPSQVSNLKPKKTTQEQDSALGENISPKSPSDGHKTDKSGTESNKDNSAKIEDFGEKILGAKKEYAAAFKDKQDRSSDVDISAEPLSKSWPEPEYNKLIESGANSEAVALFRAMRDEVPPKPRKWGVSRWVEQVKALRDSAYRLLDDPEYLARFQAETKKTEHLKIDDVVNGRAALYQLVGHEKSLKGIRISRHEYSLYDGVEYKPAKVVWSVEKEPSATSFGNWPKQISTGDTRQEAIDGFVSKYSTMDEGKGKNDVSFGIYSDQTSNGDGFFIGKKVGRNVVRIKTKFGSVVEARKYLADNKEELIKILEAKKAVPRERYDINQPRVGVDMRNAQDVTPEMFQNAFGFRGVQFGNYVEGSRRQKDLNDAYDALMDMAAVLDIPVKALSLNGELGLAFGARGSGGKNAASAHYESGQVVINLTKGNGAGSLAHEWWHGLSNYFSRMRGNADGYMTGGKERDVDSASHGGDFLAKDGVRREMVQAFGDVVRAINSTGMRERASSLDKRRTKEYWGTGEEMAARSFERFIIAKLQDQGAANDYLANIVSEEYWNAEDTLGIGEGGSYPYPTVSELPKIRSGFDNFFQVIESKQTDTGVALYSRLDKQDVTEDYERSEDQSAADLLNRGMAKAMNNNEWENAYAQNKLPDSLLGFQRAVQTGFGKSVFAITATEAKFDKFNGINYGGNLYVNLNGNVGFVNIAGHELYEQIVKERPDLHEWFAEQARKHYYGLAEYQEKLAALTEEGVVSAYEAEKELLADFTGDAFADPKFLAQLAKADRSKFKQLLRSVIKWLHEVGEKLTGKDLGSSKYFNDIDVLRKHLAKVLIAFHSKDGLQRISQMDKPSFTKEKTIAKNPLAGEDIKNNPTFSRSDDKTSPLSIERVQEVAKKIGKYSAVYTDSGKPDTSIISRIFQTPEYYFNKIPALGRMMAAALNRATLRFNYENKILGKDFIQYTLNLQKTNKVEYDLANDYLVDTDQTRHAFGLKNVGDGWQVLDREGNKLKDSDGNEIGKYEDEQEAVKGLMQAEHDDLIDKGYSKEAVKAVLLARQVLNAEFDMRIADMRKIEEEYKRNGMPSPFVSDKDTDGEGMYGIYAKGKGKAIALFSTEEDAKVALGNAAKFISYVVTSKDGKEHWFASEMRASRWVKAHGGAVDSRARFENLSVRKRTEKEMRPLTLTQAMAQMGDLRGSYFPRIRPSGEYVLIAKKKGENSRREHFDVPVAGEKWGKKGEAVNWTMALVGKLSPNAASRMAELKGHGYTVEFKKDDSPVEEIFDAAKLISSVDAIIADNLDKINKNDSDEVKAAVHVDSILTLQIADIFKGRGALSSRMKRLDGDQVWEGYETDMLMAITQSAKNTAAGSAKRDTASAMIRAFTGRDFDYQDYKDQQKEQGLAPSWDEYMKIVDDRKVHSGKQKNGYRDGRAFMIDVLRNSEHADRIMGTLQGLAVLKFLGFRVSSAAVNITNMVTGVPGTISGMTGDSIHTALGRVMGAASAYGKFRSGKGELSAEDRDIFQYIVDNGWDEAQFNHEAASVLLSKSGAVWSKFTNASMWMFGAIEKVNRATTIHAAYKAIMAKNPSKGFEVAMKEAEHISNQAHGVYGKETLPMWARGRINPLRMLYTFQKFSHNYMMNMYDIGWKKKQYKAAAYLMLSPAILGGAGASLATPVLMALAGALGVGGDDPEEEFYKWSAENLGSDTIARHGLAGLAGVNLKASLGSNVSMPTKIPELFGAPGAVVTDVWKAGKLFSKGEVSKGAEVLLPTAFGSMFKAVREGSEGISTGNYGTVFYGNEPLKADTWDATLRFFSFNPARISGIREKQWNEKQVAAMYQERKNEIYSEMKRLHLQDEPYLTPETLKEVSRYNEMVKGSGRRDIKPITPQGIRLMLRRSNRASKFERNRALDDIAVNE